MKWFRFVLWPLQSSSSSLCHNTWLAVPKMVCFLCIVPCAVLFPNSESGQRLYRKSHEHPSALDIFYGCDTFCDSISTQWMVRFLRMNSSPRRGVMAVQLTDKMHFKRLEGLLRMMTAVIIAVLPSVESVTVYRDLLCLIWFSQKRIEVISLGLLYPPSRCGNWGSRRLNDRPSKLPSLLITPTPLPNYSL